ncbi:MAG: hypothetical protein ACE5E8_07500, partial [Acidimicrobiia bacterium]
MQTRSYDIKEPKRALKAVLDVLQDEGFIPKEVNTDMGYVYAAKEVDLENAKERFWATFLHGRRDARWRKNSVIECAANVTKRHGDVRVRISFQVKVFDNNGHVLSVGRVDAPRFYQDFFTSVGKGIFIEKEGV